MTEDCPRWVFDHGDSVAHALADQSRSQSDTLVTICGRALPADRTPTFSVPPSLAICPTCQHSGRVPWPPAVFPTPTHY